MEIVKKFEMVWPSIDQRKSLKLFGMESAGDRLGLYGPNGGMGSGRAMSQGRMSNQDEDDSFARETKTQQIPGMKASGNNNGVPKSMMAGKNSKLPPVSAGGAKGARGNGAGPGKVNAGLRNRKGAISANQEDD